nr:hypothetical protein [Tanacetum cinerariifolium]
TNVAKAEVDSLVRSSVPIMTTVTTITSTVDHASVSKKKLVEPSSFCADSSSAGGTDPTTGVFSDLTGSDFLMVDEFAPPKFFAYVCRIEHDQLFTEFNVRVARQMSLSAEAKEGEIENLKAQLLLRKSEAAEAIHLRAQAFNFEVVEKSLWDVTNALKERNAILKKERNALDVKVTELEASTVGKERELTDLNALITYVHELEISSSGLQEKVTVYENYMDQLEKFQDDRMKFVNEKFDKLYTDFIEMALHLEEKFYLHLITTVFGRRWLLTHGMELAIFKCLNSP